MEDYKYNNKTEKDLLEDCKNNYSAMILLAKLISINASRQCINDEIIQISSCEKTFNKCGIYITNLSPIAYRPVKNGEIVDNNEYKNKKINKNDCLKSFDAKFNGKISGWIFAKIIIGNGGHQDNVFEETYNFCEWVCKYENNKELFIVLIDTNIIDKYTNIINKYSNCHYLIIGNHIKIQQYIIDNYYCDNK